MNLLSPQEKNALRKEYRLRFFVVFFLMSFFILLAAIVTFLPTYFFTVSRYDLFFTESQSDEIQNRLSRAKEAEKTILETNKKIILLKSDASVPRVKDIFFEISQSKNSGIVITSLSYENNGGAVTKKGKDPVLAKVNIRGRSSTRETLLAFKDALTQNKQFSNIDLPISSLVKESDIDFSINTTVNPAVF
jgi:hypothetical protein